MPTGQSTEAFNQEFLFPNDYIKLTTAILTPWSILVSWPESQDLKVKAVGDNITFKPSDLTAFYFQRGKEPGEVGVEGGMWGGGGVSEPSG